MQESSAQIRSSLLVGAVGILGNRSADGVEESGMEEKLSKVPGKQYGTKIRILPGATDGRCEKYPCHGEERLDYIVLSTTQTMEDQLYSSTHSFDFSEIKGEKRRALAEP